LSVSLARFSAPLHGINALAGIAPTVRLSMPIKMSSAPNMYGSFGRQEQRYQGADPVATTGNQSWSYQPGTGQLTDAAAPGPARR
jgi:hypothetical protein